MVSNLDADSTDSIMVAHKLDNYLRTYRKRAGLTQREVAFLLGCETGAQISRYEKRHRLPPLRTALEFEAVFRVPVSQLFAGISEAASKRVEKRSAVLQEKLMATRGSGDNDPANTHKLRWFASRNGVNSLNQKTKS